MERDPTPFGEDYLFRDNQFTAVKTAFRTNMVKQNLVSATAAFDKIRRDQFHIDLLPPARSCLRCL
jgi:hypothetical protein